MIKELAEIDVKPGHESDFESAAALAAPLFLGSKGCSSFMVHRSLEQPTRYRLVVDWDSIEDHMVEFRNSDAFLKWRKLVAPYFACPPRVEHLVVAIKG